MERGGPVLLLLPLLGILAGTADASHPCDAIDVNFDHWVGKAINKDVVVLGGGIAGLTAMKTFIENQVSNVVLLEAQDYLGGRVKTYREGPILVEEGAEWIHGGIDNPLYELAENLGKLTQPLLDSEYDWRPRTSEGDDVNEAGYEVAVEVSDACEGDSALSDYYDTAYGQCYLDRFNSSYDNNSASPEERDAWLHYLKMWVERDTGTNNWMDQSARDADQFINWEVDVLNQWSQGYDALTKYLKNYIPKDKIKISSPVCKIFWDSHPSGKVLVVTGNQKSYLADYILVTASIGHLKDRHLKLFDPHLPEYYQNNLDGIELGIADKVQLGWKEPWWNVAHPRPLDLHIIFKKFTLPAEQSWLYGVMEVMGIHQQMNMLQAFVMGDRALQMEDLPSVTVKEHILNLLRRVTGQNVPEPTFFQRSQWGKNIWVKGAYSSYITVDGDKKGLKSRTPLAETITNSYDNEVIHWAGEHTHNTRYGTVDGAMASGETAALAIIDDMESDF